MSREHEALPNGLDDIITEPDSDILTAIILV
ncbi:MAG: hypothetical protein J07HQX50_00835 [Haloquadratum sp. J07HQX50]|nr:MAG: hypothetical protein J07HQX50_00835 [Haloquadratum sp. J07HQX50]